MNQNWNNGRGYSDAQWMNASTNHRVGQQQSLGQRQAQALGRTVTADDQAQALGLPPLEGSDRYLLMMAAKAAGIAWPQPVWNPLTDDGDALRLAVKLQMRVTIYPVCTDASAYGKSDLREIGSDPAIATRRAIVRAAAEIGKQQAAEKD